MEAHQLVEMKYILFLVVVVHPNFLWVFGLCKLNKTFILFRPPSDGGLMIPQEQKNDVS